MSTDLVSRRLRLLLSDWLSSNSVLHEIENEFEAEGIAYKPDPSQNAGGQRRTLVQGYYNGLDFTDARDARKFLTVLSVFMRQMESYASATSDTATLDRFQDQLRRDGYAYQQGTISPITAAARLADAKAIAHNFDAAHIGEQIQRIEASIDADPALAIGTAKELAESCFKTILGERGVEYGAGRRPPSTWTESLQGTQASSSMTCRSRSRALIPSDGFSATSRPSCRVLPKSAACTAPATARMVVLEG